MKFQKEDFWLGGLLLTAWAALNERVLFQGHSYVLLDASSIFYHLWKWGGDALRAGRIPLWCPDAALGMPYLADPTNAPLYPVKLLCYLLFDPTTAFTVLLSGHWIWGMVGFWFLARGRGFSSRIPFWGCLIFGFSFNAVTLFWSPCMALAMAWTPWVFFAFEKLIKGDKAGWLLYSGTTAFQWAAGYPLFGFMTILLLLLDYSSRSWTEKKTFLARKALLAFSGLVCAGLFNSTWALPLAEFAPHSNLSRRVEMASSVQWRDWGTWLNPFFLGHPLFTSTTEFIFRVYFIGLPALVVVLHGFLRGRLLFRDLLLLTAVLWMSLGETTFLGGWLKFLVPGYRWVVRSGYWVPFVVMITALASLEVLEKFYWERKFGVNMLGITLSIVLYASALFLGVPIGLWSFWISLGFLLLFFNRNWKGSIRTSLLCASLLFSLGPVDRAVFFTLPRSFYNDAPSLTLNFSQPGRLYQAPKWVDGFHTVSGNGVAGVYEKIKENLVPNWPLSFKLQEAGYSNTLFMKSFLDWYYLPSRADARISREVLDYLGARYVMGLPAPKKAVQFGGEVWDNPGAMPLWFSIRKAWLNNPLESLGNLKFDLKKDAFVQSPGLEGAYSPRKVTEIFRSPNEVKLFAMGSGRALLVSSETNYPGWWALINGTPKPLVTVNGIFRGVVLENGETEVEIVYKPVVFQLGLFLSLLACAIWVGMLLKVRISFYA